MINNGKVYTEVYILVVHFGYLKIGLNIDEVSSELLLCVAYLNSKESFNTFDKKILFKLTSFYPSEFFNINLIAFT
jgi:hypothetical protein